MKYSTPFLKLSKILKTKKIINFFGPFIKQEQTLGFIYMLVGRDGKINSNPC